MLLLFYFVTQLLNETTWPSLNFQVSMFALFSLNTDKDFQLSPWRSINYHSATEL